MRKRLISSAVVLLLCGSSAFSFHAEAHWQYTRWSMTPEQVEAVAKGQAERLSGEEQAANTTMDGRNIAILRAPYSSGSYHFDAIFSFDKDSKKLSLVSLKLKEIERANELIGSLKAKYGKPESENNMPFLTSATWHSDGDQISIVVIDGTSASVTYAPRNTSDNQGL